ncbi:MAG: hypothetical protein AAF747_04495 [Planctomycetota bacterium]
MVDSFRAVCSDFYINLKLGLKLELPTGPGAGRDTVLSFFERLRRSHPAMTGFRRYEGEMELDTPQDSPGPQQWAAVKRTSIRAGSVNPDTIEKALALHREILELAPFYLSISPLDVEMIEVLFGFDLHLPDQAVPGIDSTTEPTSAQSPDAVVAEALFADSPLAPLLRIEGTTPSDCQPLFGVTIDGDPHTEAYFEVKTRPTRAGQSGEQAEPISVYVTARHTGPCASLDELPGRCTALAHRAAGLCESVAIPSLIVPIRDAMLSGS